MVTRLSLISLLILLVLGAVAALQPEHRASHQSPRNPVSGRDREPRTAVPQYTRLVFDDDFSGPAGSPPSSARWTRDVGAYGWPDHELETDTASDANAGLDGHGDLAIVARRQPAVGPDRRARDYTSARLETQGLFSVKYGLIEARIKVPVGAGLWSAFWMLGSDVSSVGWPRSGEVDVLETLGQRPFVVHAGVHGPAARGAYQQGEDFQAAIPLTSGFHTYGIAWSRNSITWLLDGVPYWTLSRAQLEPGQAWVFNRPFHLLLDLAVGGDYPGPPTASTRFPATMLVNWVRVYQ
jgi:beta-glucanase (GH16 family)